MATLSGTVISVNISTTAKNQAGTSYPAWELIIKGADGRVLPIQRHLNSLKFNPTLQSQLTGLVPGDFVTVYQEKNEKGFNEVKEVQKGELTSPTAGTSYVPPSLGRETVANTVARSGKVVGSNYETPEERATRQRLIVAQSSITASLGYYEQNGIKKMSTDDLKATANIIFDYVMAKGQPEVQPDVEPN